ncbi:MAG: hypothetical protein DMG81_01580 [Acidobacteria bacterium]|nr:MAG: hypothetical protein DMG81_01580 [Acidobacteriota bacterium]
MKTKHLLGVFVICFIVSGDSYAKGRAQQTPDAGDRATTSEAFGKPPSTYSPPPDQYEKAVAYSAAHYRHALIGSLWAILVPLLILRWRLAPGYRDWAERVSARRFVQVLFYAPLLLLTIGLLGIPFDAWDHWLARAFGLSVQAWGSWLGDWMTNQVIALILGTLLVWILYAVIRRSPRRWWFYFWLSVIPIVLAVFFIQPLVIDPLFFKFTPLQTTQPELVLKLEQVIHRGAIEIPPERMFEMNASSKLTGLNAYVTGFGASKRRPKCSSSSAMRWDITFCITFQRKSASSPCCCSLSCIWVTGCPSGC